MTTAKSTKDAATPNPVQAMPDKIEASIIPDAGMIGLTPLQHVTAIIAGGVVGGMLARTKSYEAIDLPKVAETIGMCAQLADLILDLEDEPCERPDA